MQRAYQTYVAFRFFIDFQKSPSSARRSEVHMARFTCEVHMARDKARLRRSRSAASRPNINKARSARQEVDL